MADLRTSPGIKVSEPPPLLYAVSLTKIIKKGSPTGQHPTGMNHGMFVFVPLHHNQLNELQIAMAQLRLDEGTGTRLLVKMLMSFSECLDLILGSGS